MTKRIKGLEAGQRAALLISECQEGITNRDVNPSPLAEQVASRGTIANIAELADAFRASELAVVHCHVAMPEAGSGIAWPVNCVLAARIAKTGALVAGTQHAASHRDLPVKQGDIVIVRHSGMAPFTGTQLDTILRNLGVETVVLAGVSTNVALPGASTEAVGLGYSVVLVEDCTAGGTAETHQMQVTMHLPLIATVADAASVRAAIGS